MTLGEKVQEVRGQLRLTQAQLAAEIGVAYSTINRWVNGHNEPQFLEKRNVTNANIQQDTQNSRR